MSSHNDDSSCEETASSLGDSNYDFIDDRSIATTDDDDEEEAEEEHGAMTESTTSSDGNEVEQAAGVEQRTLPSLHRRQVSDGRSGDSPQSLRTPTFGTHCAPDLDAEDFVHDHRGYMATYTDPIVFEEPSVINLKSANRIDVSYLLKSTNTPEYPKLENLPSSVKPSEVTASLRQAMASRNLDIKESVYRIFYVGPSSSREAVIQKLATALAATDKEKVSYSQEKRGSKFNVVPISNFGDQENPEVVLIDSSGLELSVDECRWVKPFPTQNQSRLIELQTSDRRSISSSWTGSSYALSENWEIPDLAVFCLSQQGDKLDPLVRRLMNRHSIKTIVISSGSSHDLSNTDQNIDPTTPHTCLEHQHPDGSVIERWLLPVTLPCFLGIDAGQLSRSLACTGAPDDEPGSPSSSLLSSQQKTEIPQDTLEGVIKGLAFQTTSAVRRSFNLKTLMAVLLFITIYGALLVSTAGKASVAMGRAGPIKAEVSSALLVPVQALQSPSFLSSPKTSSIIPHTTVATHTAPQKGFSTGSEIASFLLDAYTPPPNKAEKFKVHQLGDCHIILRAPHWFTKSKKIPLLTFRVTRHAMTLEHQVSTLFDGVYAIQIARGEAYGLLRVQILTGFRPIINESHSVDFGSSWLKIAAWKRATKALTASMRHDLNLVQTSVSAVYNQTRFELSTFVQNARDQVVTRGSHQSPNPSPKLGWRAHTRAVIAAQAKDLSRIFSDKLHYGRKQTSKQMFAIRKDLQSILQNLRNVSDDIRRISDEIARAFVNPVSSALQSASRYNRTTFTEAYRATPKRLQSNLMMVKNHYRACQKGTLKMWWKVRGVPRGRPGPAGADRQRSRLQKTAARRYRG